MEEKSIWPRWTFWIPIGLIMTCLILFIINISSTNWVGLAYGENTIELGLIKCKDCPEAYESWGMECFAKFACQAENSIGFCKSFDDIYKASSGFISLEILSGVMGMILLEKLIMLLAGKYFGSEAYLTMIGALMLFFHTLGVSLWFYLSEASYDIRCSEVSENPLGTSVCARSGPKLAIFESFFILLALFSIYLTYYHRDDDLYQYSDLTQHRIIFGLKEFYWYLIVLFIMIANAVLILFSFLNDKWTIRAAVNKSWIGSITHCNKCNDNFNDLPWGCLASYECLIDKDLGTCKMYSSLYAASNAYIIFQSLALAVSFLFGYSLLMIIFGKNYGFPYANYAYAAIIPILNVIATISWFGESGAWFSNECDKAAASFSTTPEICSATGPLLALISIPSSIAMMIIFILTYKKRASSLDSFSMRELT
ncbi:unnamed protein product [Blepharisma stoltei]|uniref:Uncharacterized protein n=1 Tax=Blepharisma stoltei TaxID=1481888 RepID=A0AAU9J3Y2_9CILI|nr:unnamed protein product [Blepharisma stoltei]